MSTTYVTTITDDITGEEGAQTVQFNLDGVEYTIDLTEANHTRLRAALAPFIHNATRTVDGRIRRGWAGTSSKTGKRVMTGRSDPAYIARVKTWAATNNIHVPARGRIPSVVLDAYKAQGGK